MADQFCDLARDRVSVRGVRTAQDPIAALAVAKALAAVDEVKGNTYRNMGRLMKAVASGGTLSLNERQMFRFQTSVATSRISELAVVLYKTCGASGIYADLPYGRHVNDILAVAGHVSNSYQLFANAWIGGLMGLNQQVVPQV